MGRGGARRGRGPALGAGASGLLRWLSPARSRGFPGRAPDGGRGRGRRPWRGGGSAQLLLLQPGLHVSRAAYPVGSWERKVAIGGVVQSATWTAGAGLCPGDLGGTVGAARAGAGPRAAPPPARGPCPPAGREPGGASREKGGQSPGRGRKEAGELGGPGSDQSGGLGRRVGGQDKGDRCGRGSCKLTQGEIARAQEDGSSGKTFPFVLEHLNVASGQGQRQGGSLSPKPVQPGPSPAQPGRLPAGRVVRNLPIAPSVSSGSPLGQMELLLGVQAALPGSMTSPLLLLE